MLKIIIFTTLRDSFWYMHRFATSALTNGIIKVLTKLSVSSVLGSVGDDEIKIKSIVI